MHNTHLPAQSGQWIIDSCRHAPAGSIAAQVPAGFEAYARILHPAMDEDGAPIRWAAVAAARHHTLRGADLFEDVSALDEQGNPLSDDAWVDGDVPAYELPIDQWRRLAGLLTRAAPGQEFIAGLWAGYAFIEGGERIQIDFEDDPAASAEQNARARTAALEAAQQPGLPEAVRRSPMLELGGGFRNYHLFALDAEQLANPLWAVTAAGEQRQRPGLAFPEDHRWMLSTEPYDDSTIVGGSRALIDAILADELLEALEVGELTRVGHSA